MLDLYVVTYNQIEMLPIVTEYWKRYPLRKIILFDNLSTDGTVDYVKEHFKNVEVQSNDTKLKDNKVICDWNNSAWKASRGLVDFVIVCDCDEVLYHPELEDRLKEAKQHRCSHLVHNPAMACITAGNVKPVEGHLYHESPRVKFSRCSADFGKILLFDPNLVGESNYSVGSHKFKAVGDIKALHSGVELLHFDYLSLDFLLTRYQNMSQRRSQADIERGFGAHYTQIVSSLTEQWESRLRVAKRVDELSDVFKR